VLSYKTPRAVGLLHPEDDGNGANSEFFWLASEPRCNADSKRLDGRYNLMGYIVGGLDLLPQLGEEHVIDSTVIRWGLDHLVRGKLGIIEILTSDD
jgi:cyclophilin family peptidyl-prolyl cis-trans isomerase